MKNLQDFQNAYQRRQALEENTKTSLSNISRFSFTEEQVKNKNIENLIGAIQVPLGVAGPIKVQSSKCKAQSYFIPLATTEGALVASVNRGCKAISEAGGANVLVENIGATRAPVFKTQSIRESQQFIDDISKNFSLIKEICESTSFHLKLLKISPFMLGKNVWLRFIYNSQDAMGLNMVTVATDRAIKDFIEPKLKIKCIALSGNVCVDKKPSWLNFIEGRGKKVWAEANIPAKIVNEVLKTTPENIYQVWLAKCMLGSAMSGSMAYNSHYANIVAAIFCATSQDLAHVVEGSLGITTVENVKNDLYISVYLPDLVIGTVGGGTGLPTQKEALAIMGIPDKKLDDGQQVLKLAEIIGGAVLAGELSLLASLAEGSLARAHQRLGRGKRITNI